MSVRKTEFCGWMRGRPADLIMLLAVHQSCQETPSTVIGCIVHCTELHSFHPRSNQFRVFLIFSPLDTRPFYDETLRCRPDKTVSRDGTVLVILHIWPRKRGIYRKTKSERVDGCTCWHQILLTDQTVLCE